MPKDVHTAMAALVRVTAASPSDTPPQPRVHRPTTRPSTPPDTHRPTTNPQPHHDPVHAEPREQSTRSTTRPGLLTGLRRVARALRT